MESNWSAKNIYIPESEKTTKLKTHSIYFYDPNGLALEITCRDKEYDQIMAKDTEVAHKVLKQWTERTRPKKESRVGSEKLNERTVDTKELFKRLKISGAI